MSQYETLMARDGHKFSAYIAKPSGKSARRGDHRAGDLRPDARVRRIADSYAANGYLCVAPALFDRVRRNLVLGYSPPELEQAHGLSQADRYRQGGAGYRTPPRPWPPRRQGRRHRLLLGRHARLGCRQRTAAGRGRELLRGGIPKLLPKIPTCPTLLHSGDQDKSIPPADIEQIRAAFPQAVYYVYPTGHAFANDDRPDHYDAEASALARSRTDAFLVQHIG